MKENGKRLYDGLTHIDDDLIEEAQAPARRKQSNPWIRWGAMAACLCLVLAGVLLNLPPRNVNVEPTDPAVSQSVDGQPAGSDDGRETENTAGQADFLAARAEYPERAAYPTDVSPDGYGAWDAWMDEQADRLDRAVTCRGALDAFFTDSIPHFLKGNAGENVVYSPLNVYLALGMLAEVTDGQSRQQILDALGADSIGILRSRVNALWNATYQDDGVTTCLLAGSLWLRDDTGYIQPTLDSLAENYYASAFRGPMGSEEYNAALRSWLNEQTGGLLKEYADGESLDPSTVIALATTIYFKAGWAEEFNTNATAPDVFHAPTGDVKCDFMHKTDAGTLYRGDGFTAVSKAMRNGDADMWFILPDEGVAPEDLLDGRFTEFLLSEKLDNTAKNYWADQTDGMIALSMPKFDVSSYTDLIPGMCAMGITDVFDGSVSDFTPLTDQVDQLYVSKANHAARVKADEEGVEAAAYTIIDVKATGMLIGEEIRFTLDRPFLFAVTGADGLPLFTGIVNRP